MCLQLNSFVTVLRRLTLHDSYWPFNPTSLVRRSRSIINPFDQPAISLKVSVRRKVVGVIDTWGREKVLDGLQTVCVKTAVMGWGSYTYHSCTGRTSPGRWRHYFQLQQCGQWSLVVKGAATFQKLGVSIFPLCPYKHPTTAVKALEGDGNGEELSPSQPTVGVGELGGAS